jgi:hypothetical protein
MAGGLQESGTRILADSFSYIPITCCGCSFFPSLGNFLENSIEHH